MTLQDAIHRCASEDSIFPDNISTESGLVEIPELGVVGIPTWNRANKNALRKIILEIRTYRGISSSAVHFYGHLVVDGVYQATLGDIETPKSLTFEQEKNNPLLQYKYNFIIKRPITKEEIESNPEMWDTYKEGDLTYRFNTTESLISDTIEIIKLRFTGNWDIKVMYPSGRKETLKID